MIKNRILEIYAYREMLKSTVRKDLRTRYKGSFLGFLWTFVNPLMQLVVYSVIFPYLLRVQEYNYAMFMFVALVPWNYFASSLQGSSNLIISNASLVTKIYFPREIIPLSYGLSGLCNLCFGYMVVIPMLLLFGIPLTWNALWLPFLFIGQFFLCAGFGMLVSAINVYFRDLEHILSILVMALYFMTPVMFNLENFPQKMRILIGLNPMTGYVIAYRDVMYYGTGLNFPALVYSLLFSLIIFVVGFQAFGRLQRNFTEVL